MADIFFSIVGIILLIGVMIGVLRIISEKYFNFYGGLGGTILAYLLNLVEFCFVGWFLGLVTIRLGLHRWIDLDWHLGLILGPIYTTYCWVKGVENKGISIFKHEN